MRNFVVLVAVVLIAQLYSAECSACTDNCDLTQTTGSLVTFCSHTNVTFTTRQAAITSKNLVRSSCYAACGVSLLHVGACGCPNNCFNESGNGVCDAANGRCSCAPGWGGKDCSVIRCPNACSGHGTCTSQSASNGGDVCNCQWGWTAYDCSIQIPTELITTPYGTLPYGEFNTSNPFYKNDKYKDAHEFFNTSRIATVKITVAPEKLQYLLNPATVFTQDWQSATLTFNNGVISKVSDVTFRLKGSGSRLDMKKSWNIKFPKGNSWKSVKTFSVKNNAADRAVTSQLVVEFYRAMRTQTYRSSLTEVFINDIHYGLYSLQEKFDDNFMESRYDVKDLNMYKSGALYGLSYLGPNQDTYKNLTNTLYDGVAQLTIEKEEGDDDWSDFVGLVTAINATANDSASYLTQHFDIPAFCRSMALEAVTRNADGYTGTSNNYIISESRSSNRPYWNFVAYDFDQAMLAFEDTLGPILGLTAAQLLELVNAGVPTYRGVDIQAYVPSTNPYVIVSHPNKPLTVAMFKIPGVNDTYTEAIKEFVRRILFDRPGTLQRRRQAFYDMVRPLVARDRTFTASTGSGLALFDSSSLKTIDFINKQFGNLASNFYAGGHGNCSAAGVCTCFTGYFGAACDSFCGVNFVQTKSSDWTTGSQWQVTLQVGSSPLYGVVLEVSTNATSFSAWNIDPVAGSTNLYTIPAWRYTDGAIPASSTSVTFGYTISGTQSATFKLKNNACVPKSCPLGLSANLQSTWTSGGINYKSYQLAVENQSNSPASKVSVQFNFYGGSYISSSWNINPSTSNPGDASKNFTCSLWNLAPGQTSTGCGYTLSVPVANVLPVNADVHVAQAYCL